MNAQKSALILRLVGIGWYVAICIAGGAIAGLALDGWLDTGPLLTIIGVLLGVAVAVIGMYRMLSGFFASPKELN